MIFLIFDRYFYMILIVEIYDSVLINIFLQDGGGLMGGPLRYSDVAVFWVQCDLV